jgi:hypothetical protein
MTAVAIFFPEKAPPPTVNELLAVAAQSPPGHLGAV